MTSSNLQSLPAKAPREAKVQRKTTETDLRISLLLDGSGQSHIKTGIAFFDHMLTSLARHALFDLDLECTGDLDVDFHHTVEDCGIVLGQALSKALGDKRGIRRFGWAYAPMDEALVRCVVDLSGRPFLSYHIQAQETHAGQFPVQLLEEFLRALANNAQANLHIELLYGRDAHHIMEASFKALAKALDAATQLEYRTKDIPSTKGQL